MDRDEVEVHKQAKKELGQYTAILTEQTWSITHTYGHYINNMLGYLSSDIVCTGKRKVFETVSYEEQIMSKDKYPRIFPLQMEAIVFIILQIFFATRVDFSSTTHYTT